MIRVIVFFYLCQLLAILGKVMSLHQLHGPVYCLYTVKQKVYTQCLIRRMEGRDPGECSCVGGTSYTRCTIKWTS